MKLIFFPKNVLHFPSLAIGDRNQRLRKQGQIEGYAMDEASLPLITVSAISRKVVIISVCSNHLMYISGFRKMARSQRSSLAR
ncbi:hypothetical protein TNCT_85571 [Trichonephila clavata]|uniref:Uncharacterized protein n=1 Tax=Trichonephila clavata TaxID=2740835 RepID=A0A8X6GBC1_TRICU|nr:hypothetical protein TNCT_85571 [Trichonephila clavata]